MINVEEGDDINNEINVNEKITKISVEALKIFLEGCETDENINSIIIQWKNSPVLSSYDDETATQIADIFVKAKEVFEEASKNGNTISDDFIKNLLVASLIVD